MQGKYNTAYPPGLLKIGCHPGTLIVSAETIMFCDRVVILFLKICSIYNPIANITK